MSKILIFGDIHIGNHFSFQNKFGENLIFSDIRKSLIQIINIAYNSEDIKHIIILGDIFHSRHPSSADKKLFSQFIKKISTRGINIYILLGNHDYIKENLNSLSDLHQLRIENVTIIESLSVIKIDDIKVGFIPYNKYDYNSIKEIIKKSDLILGHFGVSDIQGFNPKNHFKISEHIDKKERKLLLLGHYHNFTKLQNNAYYIGSPVRLTFAERDIDKVVGIYDTEIMEIKFKKLNVRDLVQLEIKSLDDLKNSNIVSGSILKIQLTSDINIRLIKEYCNDKNMYLYQILDDVNENEISVDQQKPKDYNELLKQYLKQINMEDLYTTASELIREEIK